jgi:FkbM family methyltransferase
MRETVMRTFGPLIGGNTRGAPPVSLDRATARRRFISENRAYLEWLHDRVADARSRRLLAERVRVRLLGIETGRAAGDVAPSSGRARVDRRLVVAGTTRRAGRLLLDRYRIPGSDGPIELDATESDILETFLHERYAYRWGGASVHVSPDDVVIDGGDGRGAAALYFADRVGAGGHVFALDLAAGSGSAIEENLARNPRLRERVSVIQRGLSDRSGDLIAYCPDGSCTSLMRIDPWGTVLADTPTVTVDDLVASHGIRRVDFIKLDVDGFEFRALRGARETIARFRPTIVAALPSGDEDLVSIPSYLDSVTRDYAFFLDRRAPGDALVLFARPGSRPPRSRSVRHA